MTVPVSASILVRSTVLAAALALAAPASQAQEADSAAARAAVDATQATDGFDVILPNAATQLKNQLTAQNPDQADRIATIVDNEAIALASRRGDLEREASRLFVNNFSQAEMEQITAFFTSEAGKKYLQATPILARELSKAARAWAAGINRDLRENVAKKLAENN